MTEAVDDLDKDGVVADVLNAPADPWLEADPPTNWRLDRCGVAFNKAKPGDDAPDEWVTVAGPVWIAGFTRDHAAGGWGAVVKWIDRDGALHDRAIPAGRFHEQGPALAQELAGEGLKIVPGQERKLLAYLGGFSTDRRVRSVAHLGWLDTTTGALAYVLPREVITRDWAEAVMFQPERYAPTTSTMKAEGTLADWREYVARPCQGNPLLLFALCCGLAGPLAKPAGLDGGGFHLHGLTSRGKTLWLQLAASCFGCGADPSYAGDLSLIRRWNATANGVEGLAAAHNDGPLLLDEIGTCTARDFGALVYAVAGGQGKTAMDSNRNLKAMRAWRCLVLSTGEVSSRQKIEDGGRGAKGGQLLRLIDLPIPDDGVIAETHGQARDAFADTLKRHCGLCYGTAGPAFIKALVDKAADASDLRQAVQKLMDQVAGELTPDKAAPEQRRTIKRFALTEVAGRMAARLGILPCAEDEVCSAVAAARDLWLTETQGQATDAERAIEAARAFILRHESRFRDVADDRATIRDLAGYRDSGRGLYLFTPDGFKEACNGSEPKAVARELVRRGWLLKDGSGFTSRHLVTGLAGRPRLYAVKTALLDGGDDE